jgi:hypothetical protein
MPFVKGWISASVREGRRWSSREAQAHSFDAIRTRRSGFPEQSCLALRWRGCGSGDRTIVGWINWRFLSPSRRLFRGAGAENHPRRNNSEHGNQKQRRDRASHATPPFPQDMDVTTEGAARQCHRRGSCRKPAGALPWGTPIGLPRGRFERGARATAMALAGQRSHAQSYAGGWVTSSIRRRGDRHFDDLEDGAACRLGYGTQGRQSALSKQRYFSWCHSSRSYSGATAPKGQAVDQRRPQARSLRIRGWGS